MSLTSSISAIKNIASGKIFILLETEPDRKMKIINPEGNVLTVPPGLFERPFLVQADDFTKNFTNEQIASIKKVQVKRNRKSSGTKKTKTKGKKLALKKGLGAEWDSDHLTFYRHHIEPLDPAQTFRIKLGNDDIFEVSKEMFEKEFNDVVVAKSYWQEGSFTYKQIPDKAKKYIKA